MQYIRAISAIIILLFSAFTAFPQKVAVVLSGGGAKGLAHVGVLKALEENNIPIDYIVGTSMGGIVGGYYAAGYSPDQIEQIIYSAEFQSWINGGMVSKYNYYFSQREPNASWLKLNLTVDSTFNTSFNSNLASDLSLNFALAEMLAQPSQRANYNFDSLFIPFRAVASDLFTQQPVIIKKGKLNDALRASLTVPFFYRPVRIDKKLLFDGGVYKNFPVEITEAEFKPDVIIGVNVAASKFVEYPFDKDEKLVSQSLLHMLFDKSDPAIIGKNGIYIEPNLINYTSFDFPKVHAIYDSGYVETLRKIEEIKSKISRTVTCEEVSEKREQYQLSYKPLLIEGIELHGFPVQQRGYMRQLFNKDKENLNIQEVREGYYKLISEDFFQNIYPGFSYNPASGFFDFEVYGKPAPKVNVEFGGNISTREISEIYIGLEFTNFSRLLFNNHLSFYTGRFYQSLQFKSRINVPYKNLFYFEPLITYNNWDFLTKKDLLFGDQKATVLRQSDSRFGINMGHPAGLKSKIIFHTSYFNNWDHFSNRKTVVLSDTLDLFVLRGFRHGVIFNKNSLNRKQYATSGEAVTVSIDHLTGTEKYEPGSTAFTTKQASINRHWFRFKFHMEQYFQMGKFQYGYLSEAVFSNQPTFANYIATLSQMPAFQPLQDSKTLFMPNFRSPNYLAAGIRNVYAIKRKVDLRLEYYGMFPIQYVVNEDEVIPTYKSDFKFHLAAGASAVYHSPVGPVSLNFNYYDDPQNKFGVFLHVGYIIFNARSLE